ncbi:MAG: FAD-dependent oxidoreductase, partial [Actinobacteria bacterium]|nr:FAD-dependent oxidoreductase [Actinomycetota bacterium]
MRLKIRKVAVNAMGERAKVVIIGGGIAGCSALYHLAKMGCTDVLLLERDELTSGSTWHAAGNVPTYSTSYSVMQVQKYSAALYRELAKDKDFPISYHVTGSVRLAHSEERMAEFRHVKSMARANDMEYDMLTPAELVDRYPLLKTGCSVAYHLALRGCTDVVLLERKQLTCGTTWHAAGLVGQLRATHNLTRLAQYTTNLFKTLEDVTGQATGFQQRGSVAVAPNQERFEELKRGASMARVFGLDVNIISPKEIADLVPLARVDDLVGGVHLPNDGVVNPIDTTQALAKGARSHGVKIFENVKVDSIIVEDGRAIGVKTTLGDGSNAKAEIRSEFVVNCAGMWARELGDAAGAIVPLHAAEHFYIVTEAVPEISPNMPVLRDPDGCGYFKEDAGKLLVGWFEPVAKPWGMKGISEEFSFTSLPEDFEHIEPLVAAATHRMPLLGKTGIRLFFNGPESFTPDDRYLLGESPDVENLFVAAGFNSIGIQSSGGAGKVLADWILDGKPPMDLWDVDVRRSMPFQRNKKYLHARTVETLGLLYAMHWPFRQPETARGVRKSVLHDRLAERGACFGEVAGWERTNWFAPAGVKPEYIYTYGKQNWFKYSAEEHHAVRNAVGLFDQSSFGKFILQGPDAMSVLNQICANEVDVPVGKI